MLNQTILIGRLTTDPEIVELENGKKRTSVILAVGRAYKNMNGEYETDFIRCLLWNGIAENTCEYCKKGDVVGIKGRIETSKYEKDGDMKYVTDVIVERITFLTSRKEHLEVFEEEDTIKKAKAKEKEKS